MTPGAFNTIAVMQALGITQSILRARTHVIFRVLVPASRTRTRAVQDKLFVSKMGVFKLEDVLPDIQLLNNDAHLEDTRHTASRMLFQYPEHVRVLCYNAVVLQDGTFIFTSKTCRSFYCYYSLTLLIAPLTSHIPSITDTANVLRPVLERKGQRRKTGSWDTYPSKWDPGLGIRLRQVAFGDDEGGFRRQEHSPDVDEWHPSHDTRLTRLIHRPRYGCLVNRESW